jgi:hypothetical protein
MDIKEFEIDEIAKFEKNKGVILTKMTRESAQKKGSYFSNFNYRKYLFSIKGF